MRRLLLTCLIITLFAAALPLAAQDDPTPEPAEPASSESIDSAIARAEAAAERAEDAAAEAAIAAQESADALSLASDMFGLFEAMSGAIGLVVPFLAIVGGLLGFRRLESAQNELRESRERFEREVRERETELDRLRDELSVSVQLQREAAGRASMALSLLPMGDRQYRAQDYNGALDTYKRALELDPDNPIIHYRIGYVYSQSGELELALEHLTRALELDPELHSALATRGYVFRRKGDHMPPGVERDMTYNRAEENFLKSLEAQPRLMDEDGESWWGALGGLYRRRGQVEQAIRAYERAADVTPHSSYPFSNLALLYVQTHNRDRMLETYKRVERLAYGEVQAEVDNYYAYADLITARLALGKFDEAADVLEMGLDAAPIDSPYTLSSLIDTLERLIEVVDPTKAVHIRGVIQQIEAYRERRAAKAAESSTD